MRRSLLGLFLFGLGILGVIGCQRAERPAVADSAQTKHPQPPTASEDKPPRIIPTQTEPKQGSDEREVGYSWERERDREQERREAPAKPDAGNNALREMLAAQARERERHWPNDPATRPNSGDRVGLLPWAKVRASLGPNDTLEEGNRDGQRYALVSGRLLVIEGTNAVDVLFAATPDGLLAGQTFLASDLFTAQEQQQIAKLLDSRTYSDQVIGRFKVSLATPSDGTSSTLPVFWIRVNLEPATRGTGAIIHAVNPLDNYTFEQLFRESKFREVNKLIRSSVGGSLTERELAEVIRPLNILADRVGYSTSRTLAAVEQGVADARRNGLEPIFGIKATSGSFAFLAATNKEALAAWRAGKGKVEGANQRNDGLAFRETKGVPKDPKEPESAGHKRRTVAEWVVQLKADDVVARREAASALGQYGKEAKEAVPSLVSALRAIDDEVRASAASALGLIRQSPEFAFQPLVDALDDPSPLVRNMADEAIRKFGEPAIVPLIAWFRDVKNKHRRTAAFALAHIGKPSVVPLTEALGDANENVRYEAALALGVIGPNADLSTPALIKALGDPIHSVRSRAAESLGNIRPSSKDAEAALNAASVDKDVFVRIEALCALALINPRRTEDSLGRLLAIHKGGHPYDRSQVIDAITRLGKPAVEFLIERWKNATDVPGRAEAVAPIIAIGKSAVPSLIDLLPSDQERFQVFAALALGKIGPDAKDALPKLRLVRKGANAQLAAAVDYALEKIGPE